MKTDIVFSHNSDDWRTPSLLYNFLIKEKKFIDLFPYCSALDQYENNEYFNEKLFINPPYSHLNTNKFKYFIDNLINQNNKIILLIPSRTDTAIFHHLLDYCHHIVFFRGRLRFNDSNPAPFPSCLLCLDKFNPLGLYPNVRYCSLEEFVKDGITYSKD